MNEIIIDGYQGIMPLDLTLVDKKYHKIMIEQHKKDIKEYKIEQQKLPQHLRYINCIDRIKKQLKVEDYIKKQRIERETKEKEQLYYLK